MFWQSHAFDRVFWTVGPYFFAACGMIWVVACGSYWKWTHGARRSCALIHRTGTRGLAAVLRNRTFRTDGSAIFAVRRSLDEWCETTLERILLTMLWPPEKVRFAIPVLPTIRPHFRLVSPVGPKTKIQTLLGHYFAHFSWLSHDDPTDHSESTASTIYARLYLTDLCLSFLGVAVLSVVVAARL